MTLVPGWTWQTMHWLVGMPVVNLCSIGWPGSSLGIVGSGLSAQAQVAGGGVGAGVDRRAVVGIDDVAGGAAAGAVVAGVVVGPEEVRGRVEEPGLGAG